jgi:tetratricopeptide (TPR) repeat protein
MAKNMANAPRAGRGASLWVCLGLALLVVAVYSGVARHGFVNYDDDHYVYENRQVRQGLTATTVGWAFSTGHASNWHPLTWISHMMDVELFGMESAAGGSTLEGPGGHHLMSVALHLLNTLLLFFVLRAMTDAFWPAVCVAALFAVHPMQVESVAWVAQRKSVLSGLFWMLTLLAYFAYTQRSTLLRYLLVVVLYAAGLAAKPMIVTLPFVLLLLDFWPLGRVRSGTRLFDRRHGWLILEKLPLFALTAASCIVTYFAQAETAVRSLDAVPMGARVANVPQAYLAYLAKLVWPDGLAVLYPLWSEGVSLAGAVVALLVLVAVTIAILRYRSRCPWFCVGWLWFLGTLVPVIGVVQVGNQAYADRYAYLPYIGLFMAVVYGVHGWLRDRPYRRTVLGAVAVAVVASFAVCAWVQTSYWKDGLTLFSRALAVTEKNATAFNNRGCEYVRQGEHLLALNDFEQAITLRSGYVVAYNNRGGIYQLMGKREEAALDFARAIQLDPDHMSAYYNRGRLFEEMGNWDRALADYARAIELSPDSPDVYNDRGHTHMKMGKSELALADFTRTIERDPGHAMAYNNRGGIYQLMGKSTEAAADYTLAVKLKPDYVNAYYNRARLFTDLGDWDGAIKNFAKAMELKPDFPQAYHDRGHMYLKMRKRELALADFTRAIEINPSSAMPYNNRGGVYQLLGKNAEAAADYAMAIKIKPDYMSAYYNRARLFTGTGNWNAAIEDYARAIELEPNYAKAYNGRGNIHVKLRHYELGLTDFTRAIDLRRNDAEAYQNLARLLAACPDPKYRDAQKAMSNGRRACELSNWKDAGALDALAAACAEAGQFDEAVTWQRKAIDVAPEQVKSSLRARLELYEHGKPYRF